ncbi:hypothetical protein KA529_04090 [Candidatus Saccharibacteria bacterium]|nr:hypothetical protein [Candidatus Saccharibacteria bacterium]
MIGRKNTGGIYSNSSRSVVDGGYRMSVRDGLLVAKPRWFWQKRKTN